MNSIAIWANTSSSTVLSSIVVEQGSDKHDGGGDGSTAIAMRGSLRSKSCM